MENLTISFDTANSLQSGVSSVTCQSYLATQRGLQIVWRGVPSDVSRALSPNEEAEAVISRFSTKKKYDYPEDSGPVDTGFVVPVAFVKINGFLVAISLREDQQALHVGQTVTVRANSDFYEPKPNRRTLSAEILD